jgi:hypothetical protein
MSTKRKAPVKCPRCSDQGFVRTGKFVITDDVARREFKDVQCPEPACAAARRWVQK